MDAHNRTIIAVMEKGKTMPRYIDAWKLIEYANNQKDKTVDANDIARFPTAAVVPVKHGKWIMDRLVSTNGGTYGVRRCSCCGAYYQDVGYGWDYCPNCGAKMDGDNGAGKQ